MARIPNIDELRLSLAHGERATQADLDLLIAELTPAKLSLRPKDKSEPLPLVDAAGKNLGTVAPRWLCHVLGLRHRCAEVLLLWRSPGIGPSLVLQIRDWDRDDSPGYLDISVGGHLTVGDSNPEEAARAEMLQETGLTVDDLERPLEYVTGYAMDEERAGENFFNSEWRDVYIATVRVDRFGAVYFADGEVAGIVVVPLVGAKRLLTQETIPLASALSESLPKCLDYLRRTGGV